MNSVSLVGQLADDPELRESTALADAVCYLRLAVPRRDRRGKREPGVVYVDVTAFGTDAEACAERLKQGAWVGLAGRLERDEWRDEGEWQVRHTVLADQLDFFAAPA